MLPQAKMDAMLVCPSEELVFLTGFSPMMCERFQGLFIKADGNCFYVCNLLYAGELRNAFKEEVPVYTWFDGDGMVETVKSILKEQGLEGKTIGVNSSAQAFNILELMDNAGVTFHNGKPLLEEMRIIKTHEELDNLRQAAKIADSAFSDVINFIKSGMKEQEVRDFFHKHMEKDGGYDCWSIVASGPNSSYPHYSDSERTIQKGDAIVLDFGCVYNGMYSDMSRTVFVDEVSDRLRKLYEIVDESNAAGEKAAKEGVLACDVDKAARDILEKYGYAETLINRVGHGIGYMIHEAPDIKKCNPRKLERGMCFSVEPGIYIAGDVGMRIEDIVIINENGETEVLNKSSRKLIIVGK